MSDWQTKPYDDLTDDDFAAMDQHPWTAEQITTAIGMALKARDMEATADLLARLAKVDPFKAGFLADAIDLAAREDRL